MARVDAILLEIFDNALTAVGEEMAAVMKRGARSMTARNGDCSTIIADRQGEVIAQGQGALFHMGYAKSVLPFVLSKWRGRLRPGDIVAVNDPYQGLSHLPDILLVSPVFRDGDVVAYVTIVAHQTDIGGRFPGGQGTASREIYEEGLILPSVLLYEQGVLNEQLRDMIAANVRAPEDVIGDLDGQAAACRRGVQGVTDLLDRYGLDVFEACIHALKAHSEAAMRKGLAQIPDGTYRCEEFFEEDGLGGAGVPLALAIAKQGDTLAVDFTGSGAQVPSAINVPWGLTCSSVYMVCRYMFAPDAPTNAGLFRPIEVVAPQGCVLNPRFPAAVGGRGMMLWRISEMIGRALAIALPDRAMADGEGGVSSITYVPASQDGRSSFLLDWYFGGWGARCTKDGVDGAPAIASGDGGGCAPVEAMEAEHPVLIESQGFVPDTGGPGKYRGTLSVSRRIRFLRDGRVLLRTSRSNSLPHGLAGGHDGTPFHAIHHSGGRAEHLPRRMFIDLEVKAGDCIDHTLPGGGGYGDPRERDRARLAADVQSGKLSRAYVKAVYGVDLADDPGDAER
ncbi:MAG: hydantoinase B/oxoprolinase family protein [Gammaproteobacteria bacterium]